MRPLSLDFLGPEVTALLLTQLAMSPALVVPRDSGSRHVSGVATSTSGGVCTYATNFFSLDGNQRITRFDIRQIAKQNVVALKIIIHTILSLLLHWLPVRRRVDFKLALLVYKSHAVLPV